MISSVDESNHGVLRFVMKFLALAGSSDGEAL